MIERLEDLILDEVNANAGTVRGTHLLDASLEAFGGARSVVIDRDGRVIAGNKTVELAVARGLPARVVESDGTRLIVVQRHDLDLATDPRARELAYLDNRTSEVGLHWNPTQLEHDLGSGLEFGTMFSQEELDELVGSSSTLERRTALPFDTAQQVLQWQAFLKVLMARYRGQTVGGQIDAWVQAVTARWVAETPVPEPEAEAESEPEADPAPPRRARKSRAKKKQDA